LSFIVTLLFKIRTVLKKEFALGYVIKAWNLSPTSVEIFARRDGVVSFLLSLLKIEPTVKLVAKDSLVQFDEGNLLGYSRMQAHPARIVSTFVGFRKSFWPLIMGLALTPVTFGLSLVVGIVMYYLSKEVSLGFRIDGRDYSIAFKSSVIHGTQVNEQAAADAVAVIERLALHSSAQLTNSKAA
jgi:hypothetical protein